MPDTDSIREQVKERYAEEARRVRQNSDAASCCGGAPAVSKSKPSCCGGNASAVNPITSNLYLDDEKAGLPAAAVAASRGCGNPTALAELKPGETVLDLGSGGGIDVLLSARRVGPHGKAYGLDMTDEMLALARDNQRNAGVENVEFLKGEIENIPLPDNSIDVIISNCVINLSGDKDRVLREALRVLKPAGRLAISDVVARGEVPAEVRRHVELWSGCIAGALEESDYRAKLEAAGFEAVAVEPTRIYSAAQCSEWFAQAGVATDKATPPIDGLFMSAFVRARKPA